MEKLNDNVEVIARPPKVKMVSMATIVDDNGNPQFHIVSTKWSKLAMVALTGLLLMLLVIGFMSYINSNRIENLEGKRKASDLRQDASDARQDKSEANNK